MQSEFVEYLRGIIPKGAERLLGMVDAAATRPEIDARVPNAKRVDQLRPFEKDLRKFATMPESSMRTVEAVRILMAIGSAVVSTRVEEMRAAQRKAEGPLDFSGGSPSPAPMSIEDCVSRMRADLGGSPLDVEIARQACSNDATYEERLRMYKEFAGITVPERSPERPAGPPVPLVALPEPEPFAHIDIMADPTGVLSYPTRDLLNLDPDDAGDYMVKLYDSSDPRAVSRALYNMSKGAMESIFDASGRAQRVAAGISVPLNSSSACFLNTTMMGISFPETAMWLPLAREASRASGNEDALRRISVLQDGVTRIVSGYAGGYNPDNYRDPITGGSGQQDTMEVLTHLNARFERNTSALNAVSLQSKISVGMKEMPGTVLTGEDMMDGSDISPLANYGDGWMQAALPREYRARRSLARRTLSTLYPIPLINVMVDVEAGAGAGGAGAGPAPVTAPVLVTPDIVAEAMDGGLVTTSISSETADTLIASDVFPDDPDKCARVVDLAKRMIRTSVNSLGQDAEIVDRQEGTVIEYGDFFQVDSETSAYYNVPGEVAQGSALRSRRCAIPSLSSLLFMSWASSCAAGSAAWRTSTINGTEGLQMNHHNLQTPSSASEVGTWGSARTVGNRLVGVPSTISSVQVTKTYAEPGDCGDPVYEYPAETPFGLNLFQKNCDEATAAFAASRFTAALSRVPSNTALRAYALHYTEAIPNPVHARHRGDPRLMSAEIMASSASTRMDNHISVRANPMEPWPMLSLAVSSNLAIKSDVAACVAVSHSRPVSCTVSRRLFTRGSNLATADTAPFDLIRTMGAELNGSARVIGTLSNPEHSIARLAEIMGQRETLGDAIRPDVWDRCQRFSRYICTTSPDNSNIGLSCGLFSVSTMVPAEPMELIAHRDLVALAQIPAATCAWMAERNSLGCFVGAAGSGPAVARFGLGSSLRHSFVGGVQVCMQVDSDVVYTMLVGGDHGSIELGTDLLKRLISNDAGQDVCPRPSRDPGAHIATRGVYSAVVTTDSDLGVEESEEDLDAWLAGVTFADLEKSKAYFQDRLGLFTAEPERPARMVEILARRGVDHSEDREVVEDGMSIRPGKKPYQLSVFGSDGRDVYTMDPTLPETIEGQYSYLMSNGVVVHGETAGPDTYLSEAPFREAKIAKYSSSIGRYRYTSAGVTAGETVLYEPWGAPSDDIQPHLTDDAWAETGVGMQSNYIRGIFPHSNAQKIPGGNLEGAIFPGGWDGVDAPWRPSQDDYRGVGFVEAGFECPDAPTGGSGPQDYIQEPAFTNRRLTRGVLTGRRCRRTPGMTQRMMVVPGQPRRDAELDVDHKELAMTLAPAIQLIANPATRSVMPCLENLTMGQIGAMATAPSDSPLNRHLHSKVLAPIGALLGLCGFPVLYSAGGEPMVLDAVEPDMVAAVRIVFEGGRATHSPEKTSMEACVRSMEAALRCLIHIGATRFAVTMLPAMEKLRGNILGLDPIKFGDERVAARIVLNEHYPLQSRVNVEFGPGMPHTRWVDGEGTVDNGVKTFIGRGNVRGKLAFAAIRNSPRDGGATCGHYTSAFAVPNPIDRKQRSWVTLNTLDSVPGVKLAGAGLDLLEALSSTARNAQWTLVKPDGSPLVSDAEEEFAFMGSQLNAVSRRLADMRNVVRVGGVQLAKTYDGLSKMLGVMHRPTGPVIPKGEFDTWAARVMSNTLFFCWAAPPAMIGAGMRDTARCALLQFRRYLEMHPVGNVRGQVPGLLARLVLDRDATRLSPEGFLAWFAGLNEDAQLYDVGVTRAAGRPAMLSRAFPPMDLREICGHGEQGATKRQRVVDLT